VSSSLFRLVKYILECCANDELCTIERPL
jgi:hypothetical protein